jgi:hypothetical protein
VTETYDGKQDERRDDVEAFSSSSPFVPLLFPSMTLAGAEEVCLRCTKA